MNNKELTKEQKIEQLNNMVIHWASEMEIPLNEISDSAVVELEEVHTEDLLRMQEDISIILRERRFYGV